MTGRVEVLLGKKIWAYFVVPDFPSVARQSNIGPSWSNCTEG
jgi:hypothetical protein